MAKIRKKPKKSINKNINKKQSTPNIAEKLDNEMVAFLDTEFLTSQIKGGPPAPSGSLPKGGETRNN